MDVSSNEIELSSGFMSKITEIWNFCDFTHESSAQFCLGPTKCLLLRISLMNRELRSGVWFENCKIAAHLHVEKKIKWNSRENVGRTNCAGILLCKQFAVSNS